MGGSGRLGVGEWVKSVNAARRTWGWACERRGVTKEEGMLSVGLGVVLGPGVVASTGISGGCLIRRDWRGCGYLTRPRTRGLFRL